jgi:uncharacterized phiE125 gp8 family phage protein
MAYKVVTAPTTEPFTRAFIKQWLKIPSSVTAEDDIIDQLIISARSWAEHGTGRALMTQTIEEYFDCWPEGGIFRLSVAPIQSITSVSYLSGGTYVTWNSSNYNVDLVSEPCRISLKINGSVPSYDALTTNAFKMVYVAGATDTANIPRITMQGMLQKIAFMYENREDIPLGGANNARQRSADALLSAQRML